MKSLAGGAAALFGELLAPQYLRARLVRHVDTFVLGKLQRAPANADCLAQVDRCTERMVATEGYSASDRGIYILAASVEGGGDVDTGALLEMLEGPDEGKTYRLASPIDRDPACAYWLARGVVEVSAGG